MAKRARDRTVTVVARWAATFGLAVVAAAGCSTAARSSAPTTSSSPAHASTTTVPGTTAGRTTVPTTGGAPTTSGTPGAGAERRPATETRYAAPTDGDARPLGSTPVSTTVSGTCVAGSDVVSNVSVYRCFAGQGVYDPCWAYVAPGAASASGVLCLPTPWSTSAVKVLAPDISAGISVSRDDLGAPWGVELTTHQQCLAVQGAHEEFRGQFIDFACSEGPTTGPSLELLGGANRDRPTWTYRSVVRTGTAFSPGPVVSVQTAWFAGPSPASTPAGCRGADVAVSAGRLSAAQGHVGLPLLFRNTSSAACSLSGYPGVAALDVHGHQVAQARRSPRGYLGGLPADARSPAVVVVPPGQTASALLEGTDARGGAASQGTATACAAYPALLVTPPNTSTSVRVRQPFPSCSAPDIHPVVVGESGTSSV